MNLSTSLTFLHLVRVLLVLRSRLAMIGAPVCFIIGLSGSCLMITGCIVRWRVSLWVAVALRPPRSAHPSTHTHTYTHSRSVTGMMIAEVFFSTDSWTSRVSWRFPYNNLKITPLCFQCFLSSATIHRSFCLNYTPSWFHHDLSTTLSRSIDLSWENTRTWLDASTVSSLHASQYM